MERGRTCDFDSMNNSTLSNKLDADIYQEKRQAAQFAHYGLAASAEALEDAGFKDGKGLEPEMTVCISNRQDMILMS
jgi:3-oxoacyl-(acyl-carrier-protein) synthase